jgi:hypothetical protein
MSALCMDSSLLAGDFDSYNRRVCIFGLSMETLIPPEFCKGSISEYVTHLLRSSGFSQRAAIPRQVQTDMATSRIGKTAVEPALGGGRAVSCKSNSETCLEFFGRLPPASTCYPGRTSEHNPPPSSGNRSRKFWLGFFTQL